MLRGRTFWTIAAAAFVVCAAGAFLMLFVFREPAPSSTRTSIAVLPLRNLSPDSADAYFVDGMTEEIISQVSRIAGVRVINLESVSRFRGERPEPGEIAQTLDVEAILEGSVRRDGERVKVAMALSDPVTGEQLWNRTYDRVVDDIFLIQEEIAAGVAGGLKVKFLGPDDSGRKAGPASYTDAYDLYLKGRYHWNRRNRADIQTALRLFGEATAKDPDFALAHVGLADCYTVFGSPEYGISPPGESYPKAEAAVRRALELDASLAEAHASMGSICFNYHWDAELAERHFRRAIELNSNYAQAYAWYADALSALGRFDEARSNIALALARDPLNLNIRASSGVKFYFGGRPDSALALFKKIEWSDSTFVPVYLWLGLVNVELGRYDEALGSIRKGIAIAGKNPLMLAGEAFVTARMGDARTTRALLADLVNLSRETYVSPYYLGAVHHALGNDEEAFAWFDRAVREKSGAIVYMNVNPALADLRGTARFGALLERAGLDVSRSAGARPAGRP